MIKLSESTANRRNVYVFCADVTNPSQPKTALTFAASDVKVVQNAGSAVNSAGTMTEVDATNTPGLYYYQSTSGEAGTLGPLLIYVKHASQVARYWREEVFSFDMYDSVRLGLSALPNANASAAGGLLTSGTGAGQIAVDGTTGATVSNVTKIAGDATAPGNVASAYNGTGYSAPTGPAQQQQVANIAVTGAALNATASSATYTTGTDTGGVANTTTADGVYDSVTDTAGTVDFFYQFDVSATLGSVAVGVNWLGYVVGVVNAIKVFAFNWGGSSWDQIGTVVGIAGTANQSEDFELTSAHTGTGGNLGLVRIRFQATGLVTSTTKTDRILLGYAVVAATAAAVASAVMEEQMSGHNTAGSYAEMVKQLPSTVASGTNGATTFSTNLGTPIANAYKNCWLCFLSGTLTGQSQPIASNDASGNITMSTAFTGAPSNTDRFIIISR